MLNIDILRKICLEEISQGTCIHLFETRNEEFCQEKWESIYYIKHLVVFSQCASFAALTKSISIFDSIHMLIADFMGTLAVGR